MPGEPYMLLITWILVRQTDAQRRGGSNVTTEIVVMWPQGCPRPPELEEARNAVSLRASGRSVALPHSDLRRLCENASLLL